MDRDHELALVERLRAGDAAAFDAVYAAYHGPLFSFLARLTRRRDVAEDLVEETWLRLVSRAGHLRHDSRLAPWLFTVARNLYVSYCRSRWFEASHAADLHWLWPAGAAPRSPFDIAAAREADRRLETALAGLPARHREVLLLVGVQGFTPVDAAGICGISPEAFRQRLHRARRLLSRRLDDREPRTSVLQEVAR